MTTHSQSGANTSLTAGLHLAEQGLSQSSNNNTDTNREKVSTANARFMEWLESLSFVRYSRLRRYVNRGWDNFIKIKETKDHLVAKEYRGASGRFAALLATDSACQMFRRFDWLSTYCILDSQAKLAAHETELMALCPRVSQDPLNPCLQSEHETLVQGIRSELGEYATLLNNRSQLLQLPKPQSNEYNNVLALIYDNPKFRGKIPLEWTYCEDEIITLNPTKRTVLTPFIDKTLNLMPAWVFNVFPLTSRLDQCKYPREVKYISEERLRRLSLVVSTAIALVFILVPVGQLYFNIQDWTKWEKFGRIIGWSCGFSICLWLCTLANAHEALAASASYCALLVVFLGLS